MLGRFSPSYQPPSTTVCGSYKRANSCKYIFLSVPEQITQWFWTDLDKYDTTHNVLQHRNLGNPTKCVLTSKKTHKAPNLLLVGRKSLIKKQNKINIISIKMLWLFVADSISLETNSWLLQLHAVHLENMFWEHFQKDWFKTNHNYNEGTYMEAIRGPHKCLHLPHRQDKNNKDPA